MNETWVTIGLGLVFIAVLVAPFLIKRVEANLELFLFVMGLIASTIAAAWSLHLVEEALVEPIKITVTVLAAGLVFHFFRHQIRVGVGVAVHRVSFRGFIFLLVVLLGFLSSVISAIVAALVLVEAVSAIDVPRRSSIRLVVMGCFAIGMGAALTPLGEPLSTIAIAKLSGEPYHADFFFLFNLLGKFVIPGVIALGLATVVLVGKHQHGVQGLVAAEKSERLAHVFVRAAKVYLFVMALIFLGTGFKPLIDLYFINIPSPVLYWVNSMSAVLDNATLTAAEIGPNLTQLQIEAALMGLLIAGGALIPGNIPNIISASKLKISSREWAQVGLPVGLVVMAVFFVAVFVRG